jgi:hypothetical protein
MPMPMPMLIMLGLCLTGGLLALVLVCFCEVAGSQVNTHLLFRFLGCIANGVPIVFCVFLAGLWGCVCIVLRTLVYRILYMSGM